ncbi:Mbov_0400 family ICE element protein [Mycoplasma zalophidermidis]|uniref:Mbov_0400 family ICE element protein n=1 Tax=Mycoplasma zalophidermidis TaxID=398174 RepID=UPI00215D00F6|nr:hypothetical protein [Mycoplasma zalophidermidis]MCR8966230.1 hypothetical protein [Mycoplasma zalophidermidis]
MFWKVWDRTRYSTNKKIDTLSHDVNGNKIQSHGGIRDKRPLIIFYNGEDAYFLNARTEKKHGNIYKGEIRVKFDNYDKYSLIDTSSIHVMKSDEFFRIYKNKQFNTLYQLNNEDSKKLIDGLSNSLESDHLTIQRISINDKYESVSEVLFSTKIKNDLPLNKSFNENYLVQTNEAVATVLHLRALIKHLKVMDDEELTNYRNAENVDEYMYKNYNGYRSKNDYIKVLNQISEPENKEEVKSKLSL